MKRIEVLAEKFKDVREVTYLEETIVWNMDFIRSVRGEEFIYTPDFLENLLEIRWKILMSFLNM